MVLYLETQINKVRCTCAEDVPTTHVDKHFPHDANHPFNKWHTASADERMGMLNNHDVWDLMDVDSQGTLSILRISTIVSNNKCGIFIRVFSGPSLETKLEVEISKNSLLDAVTTASLAMFPSPSRHQQTRQSYQTSQERHTGSHTSSSRQITSRECRCRFSKVR